MIPPPEIGQYTVDREVGRGGMGVVYLARDTRLDRNVAIKALPEHLTADLDRLARFDREARTLATLSHPNIAGIHGVEEHDGAKYLVLEYVEGPTLAERLDAGPLPIDDALELCIQIAAGVEAAHDAGVIHRDLKPGNIKITPEGQAKVLDFGLAKPTEAISGSSFVTGSATLATTPTPHTPTVPGAILGTAPYMSPEQARGRPVDKRSDVWSFAVVLYECLTGAGPFVGETMTDSIGAILHKDVNLELLPPGTPAQVRHVLQRCLERDKSKRLRDIGDARLELEDALNNPEEVLGATPLAGTRRASLVVVAGLAAALGLIVGALAMTFAGAEFGSAQSPVVRAFIPPPEGSNFHLAGTNPGPVVLSPDGSRMVFSAPIASGLIMLWMRDLDETEPRMIAGTEDARYPFWSPDGRHIGFFAQSRLKRVPADGGAVLALAEATNGKGGAWSSNGSIVFAPDSTSTLSIISESGGTPRELTTLDEEQGHNSHRHPRFLPDGEQFLYLARIGSGEVASSQGHAVMLARIDAPNEVTLVTHSVSNVEYASGRLLFMLGDVLLAQPFDTKAGTLQGDPTALCDHVANIPGAVAGVFSVSQNGVLVYQTGTGTLMPSQLVWYDREGTQLGVMGEPAPFMSFSISPDDSLVASVILDDQRGTGDIWIDDLRRDVRSRLTFEASHEGWPTFTHDGQHVCYFTDRAGPVTICASPVAGFESEKVIYESTQDAYPSAWTPDGQYLAFTLWDAPEDENGMYLLPAAGGELKRIAGAPGIQGNARFSPDGRLVTYSSNESGSFEVYVAPYPQLTRKWPVSRDGGGWPCWGADGTELFYHSAAGQLMVASVEITERDVSIGRPVSIHDLDAPPDNFRRFDVTSDGARILVHEAMTQAVSEPLTLVVNWTRHIED